MKKIIIGSIIVVVAAAFVAVGVLKNSGSSPAFSGGKSISVKTAVAESGDIAAAVSASGVVEEIEKAEAYIDTPLKVKEVLVEKNQKVAKGQKVLEVDLDDMNSQLEDLKISRSILLLDRNSTTLKAEVVRAENSVKSAERAYNDSVKTYEKNKKLFEGSAISKDELEMSEKAAADTKTALDTAKSTYKTAVENLGIEKEAQEQNLRSTELKISDLEKKIRKVNESILSPIDGVISEMNVVKGSLTSSMQPVFKVVNPAKLRVNAKVSEYNIKNMAVGQEAIITGDAIDKDSRITGNVASISPVAEKSTTSGGEETTIEVLIDIDNSNPILKPGLSVTCDITTNSKKDVLLIGLEALKEDKDGNKSLFVVDESSNTMYEKPVKLGITSDMKAEVLEGINAGDVIVLEPQPSYKDGAKVKPVKIEKK